MLRSRMLPDGFKLFFGIFVFALFGAFIVGAGSVLKTADGASVSDNLNQVGIVQTVTGPLSLGWKGGVGNHVAYTILLATTVAAGFIAALLVAFRDADPEAEAAVLQLDSVPLTKAPSGANYSPIVATFAVALMGIGLIKNTNVFYGGVVLLVLTIGTWAVRAWAERATGDDEVNAQIYHRIIDPLRVPIVGILVIGFVVFGISRVFISAPSKDASTLYFLLFGLVLFLVLVSVALLAPKVPRSVIVTLLVIGAVLVLAGTVYGLAEGPREPEKTSETHSTGGSTTEGGLAPVGSGAQR
jgi:hypothetical protein